MTGSPRLENADRRLAALFGDESPDRAPGPWWRRRRGRMAIVVVAVALVVSGFVAASAFGSSGGDYRTAPAEIEDVDAVHTGVATIEPVAQAAVAFPVSGTVASVNVQIGQTVAAGGTLASLDTQALMEALHAKQATLAQAQLTLAKALAGQSVGGIGTGGAGGSSSTSGAAAAAAVRTGTPSRIVLTAAQSGTPLATAQQAVLAAQQQVDAALAAAAAALTGETTACASFTTSTPSSPTPASPPDVTACQQAITAVSDAQHAVAAAQQALAAASSALDALLAQQATAPPPTTTPSTPSTGAAGSGSGSSGASRSSGASGGTSSSPSAADLIAYQQSVDSAAAAAAVAQQAVDQATIASPLAGTVVAVDMKVGDSVSADSATEHVVVQGTGGYEVTTTVSVDDIPSVSVGQAASVVPDGTHTALPGKVVAISVAPVSTSTTSTLYRVTVGLTNPNAKLNNGATGTVSIVTKDAKSALAVPTSAVTTTRNRHFVSVVSGGSVTAVPVDVGVVGDTWTEITHGLSKGQEVMLANESAPLPSSATASTGATTGPSQLGGFGRFGGLGGGGTGRTGAAGRTG
jgi:multidrug efflux pump subunit AcrA (membrane-fusion protein)